MNRKRVQRLWREEGLRVPLKRRKRQRLGDSAVPAVRLRAERPNHVWALDVQSDQTADGRVLKLLNIVDEHTREALAIVAARRINADATAATLDRIVAGRGTAPGYIRCDNGPESRRQVPAFDSVRSLVRRNSLISRAKAVMVSTLSRSTRRSDSVLRASSAAVSKRS